VLSLSVIRSDSDGDATNQLLDEVEAEEASGFKDAVYAALEEVERKLDPSPLAMDTSEREGNK
jgi:hypothetical protein